MHINFVFIMFTELFNQFLQNANEYGSVIRYWVGTSLYILISDLKDLEVIIQ